MIANLRTLAPPVTARYELLRGGEMQQARQAHVDVRFDPVSTACGWVTTGSQRLWPNLRASMLGRSCENRRARRRLGDLPSLTRCGPRRTVGQQPGRQRHWCGLRHRRRTRRAAAMSGADSSWSSASISSWRLTRGLAGRPDTLCGVETPVDRGRRALTRRRSPGPTSPPPRRPFRGGCWSSVGAMCRWCPIRRSRTCLRGSSGWRYPRPPAPRTCSRCRDQGTRQARSRSYRWRTDQR